MVLPSAQRGSITPGRNCRTEEEGPPRITTRVQSDRMREARNQERSFRRRRQPILGVCSPGVSLLHSWATAGVAQMVGGGQARQTPAPGTPRALGLDSPATGHRVRMLRSRCEAEEHRGGPGKAAWGCVWTAPEESVGAGSVKQAPQTGHRTQEKYIGNCQAVTIHFYL